MISYKPCFGKLTLRCTCFLAFFTILFSNHYFSRANGLLRLSHSNNVNLVKPRTLSKGAKKRLHQTNFEIFSFLENDPPPLNFVSGYGPEM